VEPAAREQANDCNLIARSERQAVDGAPGYSLKIEDPIFDKLASKPAREIIASDDILGACNVGSMTHKGHRIASRRWRLASNRHVRAADQQQPQAESQRRPTEDHVLWPGTRNR
jgi:hypothetical protein